MRFALRHHCTLLQGPPEHQFGVQPSCPRGDSRALFLPSQVSPPPLLCCAMVAEAGVCPLLTVEETLWCSFGSGAAKPQGFTVFSAELPRLGSSLPALQHRLGPCGFPPLHRPAASRAWRKGRSAEKVGAPSGAVPGLCPLLFHHGVHLGQSGTTGRNRCPQSSGMEFPSASALDGRRAWLAGCLLSGRKRPRALRDPAWGCVRSALEDAAGCLLQPALHLGCGRAYQRANLPACGCQHVRTAAPALHGRGHGGWTKPERAKPAHLQSRRFINADPASAATPPWGHPPVPSRELLQPPRDVGPLWGPGPRAPGSPQQHRWGFARGRTPALLKAEAPILPGKFLQPSPAKDGQIKDVLGIWTSPAYCVNNLLQA